MNVKTFVDTGILVAAVLAEHPEHDVCESLLSAEADIFTDAHCLAEVFATLSGFYKVPTAQAAELTLSIANLFHVEPLALSDYIKTIGEARRRGVMGGGIYDSLHATIARKAGARRVAT